MVGKVAGGLVVLGAVLFCGVAAAEPTDEDRAGARSAAIAGATAMEEGRLEEAVDLFNRAEALMHAPTHLLYLARAQVKLGKLVRARENYLKIVREQLPPGAPRAFVDARATAEKEASDLEGRIPTVRVVVEGEGARDAEMTLDGQKLSAALAGIPFPIDPGEHKFQARTKTLESDVMTTSFTEGSREPLTVTLSLTKALPAGPTTAAPVPVTKNDDASATGKKGGSRVPAFVAFGVGAVGVAAGTVFMLQNRSKRSEADELCADGRCPLSKRAQIDGLDDDASSAATFSWIGYGVGAAGIAAGAVLWVLSSPKTESGNQANLRPIVSGGAAGGFFGIGGTY